MGTRVGHVRHAGRSRRHCNTSRSHGTESDVGSKPGVVQYMRCNDAVRKSIAVACKPPPAGIGFSPAGSGGVGFVRLKLDAEVSEDVEVLTVDGARMSNCWMRAGSRGVGCGRSGGAKLARGGGGGEDGW